MGRREDLQQCFDKIDPEKKVVIIRLIDYTVELEEKLDELRKLPMIEVNPTNPMKQRATPASKMYKDLLGQYNVCIKNLRSALGKDDSKEESPLRLYLKRLQND